MKTKIVKIIFSTELTDEQVREKITELLNEIKAPDTSVNPVIQEYDSYIDSE